MAQNIKIIKLKTNPSTACMLFMILFMHQLQESSYNPQVEAISPTLPNDDAKDEIKQSKDELLQNINKVDRDITKIEQNIQKLKNKQVIFKHLFSSFIILLTIMRLLTLWLPLSGEPAIHFFSRWRPYSGNRQVYN